MSYLIDFVKGLIAREPARLVAWSSAIAVAGALKLAQLLGVEFNAEILAGVSAAAALLVTELIRRFVFSPATVDAIAAGAAWTGDPTVGPPPSGYQENDELPKPYTGEEEE